MPLEREGVQRAQGLLFVNSKNVLQAPVVQATQPALKEGSVLEPP
jgi:hypothetical protein